MAASRHWPEIWRRSRTVDAGDPAVHSGGPSARPVSAIAPQAAHSAVSSAAASPARVSLAATSPAYGSMPRAALTGSMIVRAALLQGIDETPLRGRLSVDALTGQRQVCRAPPADAAGNAHRAPRAG